MLLFCNKKATAQDKEWDEAIKKSADISYSLLRWVFDERFVNNKKPVTIKISPEDSAYLKYSFDTLNSVETVIIENIEHEPLDLIFKRLAELSSLKKIELTQRFFFPKKDSVQNNNIKLPASINSLKKLEIISFQRCKEIDMDDALQKILNLPSLKYLLIENSNLTSLPKVLYHFSNLKGLSLNGNAIRYFPHEFLKLSKLKFLVFNINKNYHTDSIFKTLSNLSSLKYLQLPYSEFDSSFTGIGSLKNLEQLEINNSKISDPNLFFNDISKAKNIKELKIYSGVCPFIPWAIGKLSGLKKLTLKYIRINSDYNKNERLHSMPSTIGMLKNLHHLDLSVNNLKQLPESFSMLKYLDTLILTNNYFDSFPASLTKLSLLTYMDFSYNQLAYIPDEIKSLKKLEFLNFNSNKIESFPNGIGGLLSLRQLHAGGNKFQHLPPTFVNLKNLQIADLKDNKLKDFPTELHKLKMLKALDLSGSNIKEISYEINQLTNLESLNLSYNYLTHLPGTFEHLKKLKLFNVVNNNLQDLPDSLGIGLQLQEFLIANYKSLYRSYFNYSKPDSLKTVLNNIIRRLPVYVPLNSNLTNVDISNNISLDSNFTIKWIQNITARHARIEAENSNITFLPETGWFNFKSNWLDIGNNEIRKLPVDILSMPNIKYLRLSKNNLPALLNTAFESKQELQLAMAETGIVSFTSLTKEILPAAKKRHDFYYYRNDFANALKWYNKIKEVDSLWAGKNFTKQNIGEIKYFNGDYSGAIKYFSQAIKEDTSVGVRILNYISPAMYYTAHSYLKLNDTLKAYEYLSILTERFSTGNTTYSSEAAILAMRFNELEKRDKYIDKAVAEYRKSKQEAGVQLNILELYVMASQPQQAIIYSDSININQLLPQQQFLFNYLQLTAKLLNKTASVNELNAFKKKYDSASFKYPQWSFELFDLWLATNKYDPKIKDNIRDLYLFVRAKLEGSTVVNRVIPFFGLNYNADLHSIL